MTNSDYNLTHLIHPPSKKKKAIISIAPDLRSCTVPYAGDTDVQTHRAPALTEKSRCTEDTSRCTNVVHHSMGR